jgi:hypothetical protein
MSDGGPSEVPGSAPQTCGCGKLFCDYAPKTIATFEICRRESYKEALQASCQMVCLHPGMRRPDSLHRRHSRCCGPTGPPPRRQGSAIHPWPRPAFARVLRTVPIQEPRSQARACGQETRERKENDTRARSYSAKGARGMKVFGTEVFRDLSVRAAASPRRRRGRRRRGTPGWRHFWRNCERHGRAAMRPLKNPNASRGG